MSTESSIETLNVPRTPGPVRADYRSLLLSGTPLLDVRAEVEFAKGAFPGSVNLPLMTDEERHLVGIRYKQAGQQSAIELGAELVSPEIRCIRIARWQAFVREYPDCALYCFRGGLRSRISQQWLVNAGMDIPLVEGGYKALRSFLIDTLTKLCKTLPVVLIGGRTGNGKTLLIKQLGSTVDLEALANHRGSSFGALTAAQPSNIDFENAVTVELMKLEEAGARCVYLEDEARLIGRVCLPDTLRLTMHDSSIVILECDIEQRIKNCFDDYVSDLLSRYVNQSGRADGFNAYSRHHKESLSRIQKRFGLENYKYALGLLEAALARHEEHNDTSGYADFIELLLRDYYDPMYDYQLSKKLDRVMFRGSAEDIIEWVDER